MCTAFGVHFLIWVQILHQMLFKTVASHWFFKFSLLWCLAGPNWSLAWQKGWAYRSEDWALGSNRYYSNCSVGMLDFWISSSKTVRSRCLILQISLELAILCSLILYVESGILAIHLRLNELIGKLHVMTGEGYYHFHDFQSYSWITLYFLMLCRAIFWQGQLLWLHIPW